MSKDVLIKKTKAFEQEDVKNKKIKQHEWKRKALKSGAKIW